MRTAFIEELTRLAGLDERIWLLTGDLGFSVLEEYAQRFPRRYCNVGVAEQNMTGMAAGLAMCGKIVFTYSIANFPTLRCLEQIRNDVCYHCANVKVVAVGGGLAYGPQGYTHHALEDLAILRTLPGLVVLAPGDPAEARLATRAAAEWNGPCYLRLGKSGETKVHPAPPAFRIGEAIVLRDGPDATFISTGGMLKTAVEAADALAVRGIHVRILSMHTVKPLDEQAILRAAQETGGIVTLEEHSIVGGLGSAVAEVLVTAGRATRFRRIALPDCHWQVAGSQEHIRKSAGDPVEETLKLLQASGRP